MEKVARMVLQEGKDIRKNGRVRKEKRNRRREE